LYQVSNFTPSPYPSPQGEGTNGNPTASGWGIKNIINYEEGSPEGGKFRLYHVIFIFKEHCGTICGRLRNIFAPFAYNYNSELIMCV